MTKYKVIATYIFDVEADDPEWAQELVDVNSLHFVIQHPLTCERVNPSYEVEEVAQKDAPETLTDMPRPWSRD